MLSLHQPTKRLAKLWKCSLSVLCLTHQHRHPRIVRSSIIHMHDSQQWAAVVAWLHNKCCLFAVACVLCIFHENRSNRLVHAIFAIFIVIASFSLKNVCMKRAIVSLYIELVLTLCWFQIYCVWVCVVFTHFYSFHSVKSTHARGGGYSSVFSHI